MASPKFFIVSFNLQYMLKISFFLKLEGLKILKDIFEKDYLIVGTEISHRFIFPFYSESVLSLD